MSTEEVAWDALRKWGCPVHREVILEYARTAMTFDGYSGTFYKALSRLAKKGSIRRIRPAVYSAYGPVRD